MQIFYCTMEPLPTIFAKGVCAFDNFRMTAYEHARMPIA